MIATAYHWHLAAELAREFPNPDALDPATARALVDMLGGLVAVQQMQLHYERVMGMQGLGSWFSSAWKKATSWVSKKVPWFKKLAPMIPYAGGFISEHLQGADRKKAEKAMKKAYQKQQAQAAQASPLTAQAVVPLAIGGGLLLMLL
ncbi:MAG: hypothetical protein KAS72_07785 [Phycisphaerales bacterium]|nr:hypothetical protein [Phycisphaerales bacterium]